MSNEPKARIEVRYITARGKSCEVWYTIEPFEFSCFDPLPRDRELDFMPESQRRAYLQTRERYKMAEMLAGPLAHKLIEAISKQDTVNGYSREEWDKMHAPAPTPPSAPLAGSGKEAGLRHDNP